MAKYISNRQQNLKIGIVSYTEDETVLEVIGNVGIGTTNATSKLWVNGDGYFVGVLTATSFFGNGSGLTNLIGVGAGIAVKDSGTVVGTAGTIDFGDNLTVSAISAGIVTVTGSAGGGSSQFVTTAAGIHTLSNVGIGTTNPTSKLHVVGDARITGILTIGTSSVVLDGANNKIYVGSGVTISATEISIGSNIIGSGGFSGNASSATYATNAGIATNLKGGVIGNIPYQSAVDTTAFLTNGGSGTILQSNGVGNAPTWITPAPANAITGLTIRDEGTIVGGANSVSTLNFVGSIVSVASTAGIATITFLDYVSNSGIATNLKGGLTGNIHYQSAADTTAFLTNGGSGTILQSNGVGIVPTWVTPAPAGAITGLTISDEGTIVGGANSISALNFVGSIVSVASTAGIATITFTAAAASAGEFNTGITNSVQIKPLSFESSVFTFPSTAGKQYVIETINVANVDTSVGIGTTVNIIASIQDSTGEQTYIAYNVPIVTGGLIELLKNPIVAGPSDVIKMWATNGGYSGVSTALEVYMNYDEYTSTEYIRKYASTVSIATTNITGIFTSTTYASVIKSIHLTNRTDSGDYPVSVTITNGVTTTFLAKDLIIPRYSTVDILDRPKRVDLNGKISIGVGQTSTIDVIIAGKQITS